MTIVTLESSLCCVNTLIVSKGWPTITVHIPPTPPGTIYILSVLCVVHCITNMKAVCSYLQDLLKFGLNFKFKLYNITELFAKVHFLMPVLQEN